MDDAISLAMDLFLKGYNTDSQGDMSDIIILGFPILIGISLS